MRLVKRGRRYSIVFEEAGRQRWISTGLTSRGAAHQELTKLRKKIRLQQQGILPYENPKLRLLSAMKVFLRRTKGQFTSKQRKSLRRRLMTICYEVFHKRLVKRKLSAIKFARVIKPYLSRKRVMDLTCPLVEDWITRQIENGRSILGHKVLIIKRFTTRFAYCARSPTTGIVERRYCRRTHLRDLMFHLQTKCPRTLRPESCGAHLRSVAVSRIA